MALSPVFCKPKLIPLKSVTLEKLERMQAEALEKLKQMAEEQKQAEEAQAEERNPDNFETSEQSADIWRADEPTPR